MYTPDDPQADAKIAADAKQEDEAIRAVCDPLGFEIFQVAPMSSWSKITPTHLTL